MKYSNFGPVCQSDEAQWCSERGISIANALNIDRHFGVVIPIHPYICFFKYGYLFIAFTITEIQKIEETEIGEKNSIF